MNATDAPGWRDLLTGANGWRSLALAGGTALHATNVYVATTVLPSIVRDIGGLDLYAWNTTLFVVASILGSVLASRVLTVLGPRAAYITALIGFTAGTVVCAGATSMAWMLAGRTLQGFGGGILLALSYALIRIVFAPPLWSRAMGLVSGMWGVATLCGPALGGVFAQFGHWRWAFWSLLPVVVALAVIIRAQVPAGRLRDADATGGDDDGAIPWFKVALLAASVLAISLAGVATSHWVAAVWVVAGLFFAIWLAARERSARHAVPRLLPTGAYSLRTRLGNIYATMSLLSIGVTCEIFVPYFLQTIHHRPPFAAGYLAALMAAGWSVGSMTSAGCQGDAADLRVRIGPVVQALGLVALAILLPMPTLFDVWPGAVAGGLALATVGYGVGIGWPHLLTRVMTVARPGEAHLASLSITTVNLYSMALGSALAGLIANSAGLADGLPDDVRNAALWLLAIFAVAPIGAACLAWRARAATLPRQQEAT